MAPENDLFTAEPTLIIGVGGTGLKVATFVKKNLLEANRNQLPRRMALLVLDTEDSIKFKAGGWGRERTARRATGPVSIERGEYRALTGNVHQLGQQVKNQQIEATSEPTLRDRQAHRHISPWFQAWHYLDEANVDLSVWNLDQGAGQYRQFGRLALFTNIDRVVTLLTDNLRTIQQQGATTANVHICGSLAGGTGAALFADMAHLVKQIAPRAGFPQAPRLFGHFVLAEGFRGTPEVDLSDAGVSQQFNARSFAALRELTRLQGAVRKSGGVRMVYDPRGTGEMNATLEESPYNAVFLYDGNRSRNPINVTPIEDGLGPAIADLIVAYVDDLSAGAFGSHSVNNQANYAAYQVPTGAVTYGTAGVYTIELPIYHITEGWTHDLARQVLDTLLMPKRRDGNPDTGTPIELESGQPGGNTRDPNKEAEEWLRTEGTPLVVLLMEWAREARRGAQLRKQTVDYVLRQDARTWQFKLAPTDDARREWVNDAHTELEGNLRDPKSAYFVKPNQGGDTLEQRVANLQDEVESKLVEMVGPSDRVWRRQGGAFRRALQRLELRHLTDFEVALIRWVRQTLNGSGTTSTSVERKQGKLGHIKGCLAEVHNILQESARVLAEAEKESEALRKPEWQVIHGARVAAVAKMQKSAGLTGGNLKEYRDRSDALAQFHKADIAREVVQHLVAQLQKVVQEVRDDVARWERILATAPAEAGGTYALLNRGRDDVMTDRLKAKNASRWVIDDNEPGDSYISGKRDQYTDGEIANLLDSIEWKVDRPDGKGALRIDFVLDGQTWDREAGQTEHRVKGERNLARLLERCRNVFSAAWSEMSVTAYLSHNWRGQEAELAQRIHNKIGYPLTLTNQNDDPPRRTTFMRAFKSGISPNDMMFLQELRTSVSVLAGETSKAGERMQANDGQDYLSTSGQDSRDRFKLSFVTFGDLIQPNQIAGFANSRRSYHTVSSAGSKWKEIHILPAETNALEIERGLTSGPHDKQQRRRELHDEVVAALEDVERFRIAMRCLAYGDSDYNWGMGERGLLLHRYSPPGNSAGHSQWRLTVEPKGHRRADGLVYGADSIVALPEYYELTPMAPEPDLLQAFIQLARLERTWLSENPRRIEWDRVEETLQHMMEQHRTLWISQHQSEWEPTEKTRRDRDLLQEAWDKAARITRLNALVKEADDTLARHRVAWSLNVSPTQEDMVAGQPNLQRHVDLWTAIRQTAQAEAVTLGQRLQTLGMWRGGVPSERIELQSQPAVDGEAEELTLLGVNGGAESRTDGWVCRNCGQANLSDAGFCEQCGRKRPSEVEAPAIAPSPSIRSDSPITGVLVSPRVKEAQVCLNGHPMAEGVKFCSECGAAPRPAAVTQTIVCLNGHPMAEGAKFCSECGAAPRPAAVTQTIVCLNGHPMAEGAKFCSECGAAPRPAAVTQTIVCLNGHPMAEGAKFCSECGARPQPVATVTEARLCLNGHPMADGAKFCPECGAGAR